MRRWSSKPPGIDDLSIGAFNRQQSSKKNGTFSGLRLKEEQAAIYFKSILNVVVIGIRFDDK